MSGPGSSASHVWLGTASLIALFSASVTLAAPPRSTEYASRREGQSSQRIVRQDPAPGWPSSQSAAGRYAEEHTSPRQWRRERRVYPRVNDGRSRGWTPSQGQGDRMEESRSTGFIGSVPMVKVGTRTPRLVDGSVGSEPLLRDHSHIVLFPGSKDPSASSGFSSRGTLSRDHERHVGDGNGTAWPNDGSDSRFDEARLGSGEGQEAGDSLAPLYVTPGSGWRSSDRRWLVVSPVVPTAQLSPLSSNPTRGRQAWVDLSTDTGASKVEAGLTLRLR